MATTTVFWSGDSLDAERNDPLQLALHIRRRLPPIVGIAIKTAADDVIERRRRDWLARRNRLRRILQNRADDARGRGAVERAHPVTIS
jgi:hypothetical protein